MCIDLCVVASTRWVVETSCPSTGGPWKICNKRLQVTSAAHLDAIAWSLEGRKLIRYHRVGFTDGIWCGNIFLGGRTWLSNALLPWCVCLLFVVLFCFSCVVCSVSMLRKLLINMSMWFFTMFLLVVVVWKWWTAGYTRCYFSKCMSKKTNLHAYIKCISKPKMTLYASIINGIYCKYISSLTEYIHTVYFCWLLILNDVLNMKVNHWPLLIYYNVRSTPGSFRITTCSQLQDELANGSSHLSHGASKYLHWHAATLDSRHDSRVLSYPGQSWVLNNV